MTGVGRTTRALLGAAAAAAALAPAVIAPRPAGTCADAPLSCGSQHASAPQDDAAAPDPSRLPVEAAVGTGRPPPQAGPEVKLAARQFVERVGSWSGTGPPDAVAQLSRAGHSPDLAAAAGPLIDRGARRARTTVIRSQLTALTEDSAAVAVLARQQRDLPTPGAREILLDLRLARLPGGGWAVSPAVTPPGRMAWPRGGPLTPTARSVLDNPRLRLPAAARSDVAAGRVGDPILQAVNALSRSHVIEVTVVVTGDPGLVLPTTRPSAHVAGRAIDITAVDGRPVESLDPRAVEQFRAEAARVGAIAVDGPGPAVPRDHLQLEVPPVPARDRR